MKFSFRFKDFFIILYKKLVRIDDSPHRIALGFSLGVFLGVLPGLGPVAAFILAILLRVNRVAAFLGGLLTNTWLTILTFFLAIRIGTFLMRLSGNEILEQIKVIVGDFYWHKLLDMSVLKIFMPLLLGYLVIASLGAVVAYIAVLYVMRLKKKRQTQLGAKL